MTLRKRKWMVKSRRGAHSQSPIPSSLPQHSYFTVSMRAPSHLASSSRRNFGTRSLNRVNIECLQ